MKKILTLLLAMGMILTACGQETATLDPTEGTSDGTADAVGTSAVPDDVDFSGTDGDMFTDRDLDTSYDEASAVKITLAGDSASATSDAVTVNGTTVKITEEATYVITGTLDDGMIVVDAADTAKVHLVLDGASVTSAESAALYILGGDKVFVTLAEGSENTLANGGTFTAMDGNNIDGAVFSKQDMTFNGSGSLTVTSPAGHGIVCKDDLVMAGGTYSVTAASHGVDANDSVRLAGASLTVASGKDGIHAENSDDANLGFVYVSSGTFDITAEGDGISAGAYMQISDGTFDIVSGGGAENGDKASSDSWGDMPGGMGGMGGMPGGMERPGGRPGMRSADPTAMEDLTTGTADDSSTSLKGIKSTGSMLIAGGTFNIDSADDAVHSNLSVTVNGGTFNIATGDDGFHADETLTITAGDITVTESYEGLEALNIAVKDGDIDLVSSDDGLNAAGGTDQSGMGGIRGDSFGGMMGGMPGGMGGMGGSSNGSIVISGGDLYVNASGDGIDANGYLEITGGYTVVVGPTQGDTATLDYDTTATISGGTFIGTGASGMAQTFSESPQGVIAVSVGNQSAGTAITLADKDGKTLIEYAPELSFGVVILSSPEIVSGETYTIGVGGETADFAAN